MSIFELVSVAAPLYCAPWCIETEPQTAMVLLCVHTEVERTYNCEHRHKQSKTKPTLLLACIAPCASDGAVDAVHGMCRC